jgi:hypothetical protein
VKGTARRITILWNFPNKIEIAKGRRRAHDSVRTWRRLCLDREAINLAISWEKESCRPIMASSQPQAPAPADLLRLSRGASRAPRRRALHLELVPPPLPAATSTGIVEAARLAIPRAGSPRAWACAVVGRRRQRLVGSRSFQARREVRPSLTAEPEDAGVREESRATMDAKNQSLAEPKDDDASMGFPGP